MAVATFTFSRTHSITFVTDGMRIVLLCLLERMGLKPDRLLDDWKVLGNAIKTWLDSNHLVGITVEFFKSGAFVALARWDLPVSYSGSGVDDDMWVDKDHLARTISKAGTIPANSNYRILLETKSGRPDVAGMVGTTYMSTGNLVSRTAGSVIAAPAITAGLRFWKAPE